MDLYLYGLFILLIFIFIARAIIRNANDKLSPAQREKLIDIFSKSSIRNLSILILLLLLFFVNVNLKFINRFLAIIIYLTTVSVFLINTLISSCQKLKDADFSSQYINCYVASTLLRTVGLVFFFVMIVNEA